VFLRISNGTHHFIEERYLIIDVQSEDWSEILVVSRSGAATTVAFAKKQRAILDMSRFFITEIAAR